MVPKVIQSGGHPKFVAVELNGALIGVAVKAPPPRMPSALPANEFHIGPQ